MEAAVQAPAFPSSSAFRAPHSPSPLRLLRSNLSVANPRARRAAAPLVASLSSLRPPTRRTNHLRRKLLKTLTTPLPPPHLVPESPQTPLERGGVEASHALVEEDDPRDLRRSLLPLFHGLPTEGHALVVEEEQTEVLLVRRQVGDARTFFPSAVNQCDVPRLLLDLSLYLVGLLAVQTLCAVWLFGSVSAEEAKKAETSINVSPEEVKGGGPKVGAREVEFERTVLAIQAMAREARAAEAREASEKEGAEGLRGDVVDEVNRRLGRMKRRMPQVHLGAKALSNTLVGRDDSKVRKTPTKGFNGSKDYAASRRDRSNGGSQQIDHDGHFKEPSLRPARRKSKAHGYYAPKEVTASSRDPVASGLGNCQTFGNQRASDQGMTEKSKKSHGMGNGGTLDILLSRELVDSISPFEEGIQHQQSDSSKKASGAASKTRNMEIPLSQSQLDEKHSSSSTHRSNYPNCKIASEKKSEHNFLHQKPEDSGSDAIDQLWWLKLPYVLAIFLHRGPDRKEFQGLYSSKLDSSSEEGSNSYTVVFQDRVDATNFCYLLESFFENLEDFSADIVPLSVQEVHDAVKSRTLKVIVVRKGQLQLYAGQPLAEAEIQFRSLLD